MDAETHYLRHCENRRGVELEKIKLWMGSTAYTYPKRENRRRLERASVKSVTHRAMAGANGLFEEYIKALRGTLTQTAFLPLLYRAELIGASVELVATGAAKRGNPAGILVEERENVFVVVHPGDKVKMYPKQSHDLIVHTNNTRYLFMGRALKLSRQLAK